MMEVDLTAAMAEMLDELVGNRGFATPLRFVIVSQNGAVLAGQMHESPDRVGGLVPTWDVEHVPSGGLEPPLHILWIDATGSEAAHAVLDRGGVRYPTAS